MKRGRDLRGPRGGKCAEERQGKVLSRLEPHRGHVAPSSACDPLLLPGPRCGLLAAI